MGDAAPEQQRLYDHRAPRGQGGIPANPFTDEMSRAAKRLKQTYTVAYVQHAPMERAPSPSGRTAS